ncbi:MAG: putative beta-lysine N-acetyltransferase [Desulfuromonadaceae bacterium]|nr:putative beta-lysine N-acetyltransferase [Desulfuromonadaceae bacterium]
MLEHFGHSLIQHGTSSDRIYLMKLAREDFPAIISQLDSLASHHGYGKIFIKVPAWARPSFEQQGYVVEAQVPGFYNGCDDAFFMARYGDPHRRVDPDASRVAEVLQVAQQKKNTSSHICCDPTLTCRPAGPKDCPRMARLYREVFASYPFPIHDSGYLASTMAQQVRYAGIWQDDELVALASAEMDCRDQNAEMTDFATLPSMRGRGLAHQLLHRLEQQAAGEGITTFYTIARATSFGMNITFAQCGYIFAGTLIRNTQISGGLESMNVWYKHAKPTDSLTQLAE